MRKSSNRSFEALGYRQMMATEVVTVKKGKLRRREELGYVATIKGQPYDEYIKQIPDERWDSFLEFIADLLFKEWQQEHASDVSQLPSVDGDGNELDPRK